MLPSGMFRDGGPVTVGGIWTWLEGGGAVVGAGLPVAGWGQGVATRVQVLSSTSL